MRVPYQWLLDYVDPGITAEALADRFTLSGVEVGEVEVFGPALPDVVVGRVEALEAHPGRSNLVLVDTFVGDCTLKIVCGAKNMVVGDKVVVAKPGSTLPGGRIIKETQIYGALSSGMLCSASELGLDLGSDEEILILDEDAPLGAPADKALGFDDKILHLEPTPNRADCLSMIGVAHEAAAITGSRVIMPPLAPQEIEQRVEDAFKIRVEDIDLCPRYTARVVTAVCMGTAPLWMRLRLLKAGIRPISNVVDITNYVMWEFGQPLHAFDLDLLKSGEIVVRRAGEGEILVTLDGVERRLTSEALVITDGAIPVGLAGVMGGENTEIRENTRGVLLEAATFSATNIRRTARRYNLPSEASQRFERGVNPQAVLWSQDRATRFMHELAEGRVLQGVIDINHLRTEPSRISVRPERINRILGFTVPEAEVKSILRRLDFQVNEASPGVLEVTVPPRRADCVLEEDIVEEVARLHGYDKIPVTLPQGAMLENRPSFSERVQDLTREVMTSCGFYECITYSFINPAGLRRLRLDEDDSRLKAIAVQNPFSEEQAVMRTTQLPGLLKAVQHNISYRELNQLLFEIGSVYEADTVPLEELPTEKPKLTLAATGLLPEPNWVTSPREADYFALKGALEMLFKRMQIGEVEFNAAAQPFTHPGRSAEISIAGLKIGFVGQLHPDVAADWDIDQAVTVAEIDLMSIEAKADLVPRVAPLPRYPAATRDIAVVVSRDIPALELDKAIRQAGGGLVGSLKLFDLYEGKQIPAGKRSLAFAITYRRDEGTLTDAEVNQVHAEIEKALFALGAVLRA